jgi:hypothetical protein
VDRWRSAARVWWAVTALVVAVALVVQVRATLRLDEGFFDSDAERVANIFVFFTIWSNILVGITSAVLAARPEQPSVVFRSVHLASVLMIAVTGIVFQVALSDIHDLQGKAAAADHLLHKVVPALAVVGWLVFGPRRTVTTEVVRGAVVIPVVWLAFTLVRGPLASDFYPYPFVDVADLGYARVLVNVAVVAVLFVGLALGARALDARLPDRDVLRPALP